MQDAVRVWSAVRVLEGFVLSLRWESSPCGGGQRLRVGIIRTVNGLLRKLDVSLCESFCTWERRDLSTLLDAPSLGLLNVRHHSLSQRN